MTEKYDTVVGLEIHVQLKTESKAFSSDENNFGDQPNENIHPVSIALPGALPKVNRSQVLSAVKLGAALNSTINSSSHFDRKNYFYPDSPKGYQITQDGNPILQGGTIHFKTGGTLKKIRIHQVHMEDDAGKSNHELHEAYSLIDLNRSGTPLLEVVTEPDFSSGQEVHDFLAAFQILLRYLEISDANMEEGSLRCDCNVSVKPTGSSTLGTRCEIKNINSKKFAKTAIAYERQRQIDLLTSGKTVDQETRLFDSIQGVTYTMRKKEDALDYRYFPDPDLQPIILSEELIENIKGGIELLPWTALEELKKRGVSADKAEALCVDKNYVLYFMSLHEAITKPKLVSDFILNHIAPRWEELEGLDLALLNERWIELLQLIKSNKVSASAAYQKLVPEILSDQNLSVLALAEQNDLILAESNSDDLEALCKEVLNSFPDKVMAYQKGKKGLIGFFMGQAMKKGKNLDPKLLQSTFGKLLS